MFISSGVKTKQGGNKMKRIVWGTMLLALLVISPVAVMADVDVSIGIDVPLPPPIEFSSAPDVVVMP